MVASETNSAPVPIFHTSFLGRSKEHGEIRALFRDPDNRLLSLVGPGGVGKTRLAVQVADTIASDLDAHLVYVPLSAAGTEQRVIDLIARAVGVAGSGVGDLPRTIAIALDRRAALIVLDNFEHLLDQAIVVGQLLAIARTSACLSPAALLWTSGASLSIPYRPLGYRRMHLASR